MRARKGTEGRMRSRLRRGLAITWVVVMVFALLPSLAALAQEELPPGWGDVPPPAEEPPAPAVPPAPPIQDPVPAAPNEPAPSEAPAPASEPELPEGWGEPAAASSDEPADPEPEAEVDPEPDEEDSGLRPSFSVPWLLLHGAEEEPDEAEEEEPIEPTLWTTDAAGNPRYDFSPGSTVYIHGSGFDPNTTYDIPVTRPDGSIIKGDGNFDPADHRYVCPDGAWACWDNTTTNGDGDLSYQYILNGIEGLYRVAVFTYPWGGPGSVDEPVATVAFSDSAGDLDIVGGSHESQQKAAGVLGSYTSGNATQYAELDPINFRLEVSHSGAGSALGTFDIGFSGDVGGGSGCSPFFQQAFALGTHDGSNPAVVTNSGATPSVSLVGAPVPGTGPSSGDWIQTVQVEFTSGPGNATIYYYLTLSDVAGECGGSSQHSRINGTGGDFGNEGDQNIPVPARAILELPQITVTKMVDRDGDGSFETTAAAGEFCFSLDGGTCVPIDAAGQVVFGNLVSTDPDADPATAHAHTITEQQLDSSLGTYIYGSGAGTNCTFDDPSATATATVQASSRGPENASCIFRNGRTKADLGIGKSDSPDPVVAGTNLTYSLVVTNHGPSVSSGFTVSDTLDANTSFVSFDNAAATAECLHLAGVITCTHSSDLAVAGTVIYTFTVSVDASVPDGTTLRNVAAVEGSDPEPAGAQSPNEAAEETSVATRADLAVTKSDAIDPAAPGGSITYTVAVTNNGPSDAENVVVTDTLPPGATLVSTSGCAQDPTGVPACALGTIAAGAGKQYTITVSVDAATLEGSISNLAVVSSDTDDPDATNNEATAVTFIDALPSITVDKTAVADIAEPGGTITYTVSITNTSDPNDPVSLLSIVDDVYGDLTDAANPLVSNSTCALAIIQPATTYTCTFEGQFTGNAGDVETDTVTVSGVDDEQIPVSGQDDHTVTLGDLPSAIEVSKTAGPATVLRTGGDVTFDVVIKNTSVADTVTIDKVSDDQFGDLSAGCTPTLPAVLAPGAALTCTFTQFLSGTVPGDHTNVVTASGQDDDGNAVQGTATAIVTFTPVIDLELNVVAQPQFGTVGLQGAYTIILTNMGPSDATGVVVANKLPAGVSFASDTSGGAFDPATGLWHVGTLAAGATVQFTIVVNLDQDGIMTDAAEVTAADEVDVDSVTGDGIGDDRDQDKIEVSQVLGTTTQVVTTTTAPTTATTTATTTAEALPVTGSETGRLATTALVLLGLGGLLVLITYRSRRALKESRDT